jgi:hypothetical protein
MRACRAGPGGRIRTCTCQFLRLMRLPIAPHRGVAEGRGFEPLLPCFGQTVVFETTAIPDSANLPHYATPDKSRLELSEEDDRFFISLFV